jgi:hypothetical protein
MHVAGIAPDGDGGSLAGGNRLFDLDSEGFMRAHGTRTMPLHLAR